MVGGANSRGIEAQIKCKMLGNKRWLVLYSFPMNAPRPWLIAETNWKHIQATRYEVAVLPWGATEAHNWHLPHATDSLQN